MIDSECVGMFPNIRQMFLNIILLGLVYVFWLATQKFLEYDNHDNSRIIDRMHDSYLFSKIHHYLLNRKYLSTILMSLTTLMIDLNVIYFTYDFLINNNRQPILLLVIGVGLRQMCQFINRLPSPKDVIWFDPGFPSLIMNYQLGNDFFFSGHTLTALIFGFELFRSANFLVRVYSVFYMIVEIGFILVTRAHYFMDVYGAVSTYFMLSYFFALS